MKKISEFLEEISNTYNLEELESGADLFQFGVDKGYYRKSEIGLFNKRYWDKKHQLLTNEIYKATKIPYLKLFNIVKAAPSRTKEDICNLKKFVFNRNKRNMNIGKIMI